MADNRREFQEMMDSANLKESRGMELLNQAEKRVGQRKKTVQRMETMLAVVVLCLVVSSGSIYAATGKNLLDVLLAHFVSVDDEMLKKLGDEYKEPMETYEFENRRVVLERYWFEQKSGALFAEISVESMDGSPLNEETCRLDLANKNMGLQSGDWRMEYVSDTELKCYYMNRGIPFGENEKTDPALIGMIYIEEEEYPIAFELENTGEWEKRQFNHSEIPGAVQVLLTPIRLTLEYESEEYLLNAEDYHLELHMKDGEIRQEGILFHTGKSDYRVNQKENGTWTVGHEISFGEIIDMDEVETIVLNGVELTSRQ